MAPRALRVHEQALAGALGQEVREHLVEGSEVSPLGISLYEDHRIAATNNGTPAREERIE